MTSARPPPSAARPTIRAPGWLRRPAGCPRVRSPRALHSERLRPRASRDPIPRASQTALVSRTTPNAPSRRARVGKAAASRIPTSRRAIACQLRALEPPVLDDALRESVGVEMRDPENQRRGRDEYRERPGMVLARVPDGDRRHHHERAVHRARDPACRSRRSGARPLGPRPSSGAPSPLTCAPVLDRHAVRTPVFSSRWPSAPAWSWREPLRAWLRASLARHLQPRERTPPPRSRNEVALVEGPPTVETTTS